MSSLRPDILVNPADLFIQTANVAGTVPYMTQVPELGVRSTTGDGREFRFIQAGASNLIVGQLVQNAGIQANYTDVTAVAVAAGATTATLTVSTGTAAVSYTHLDVYKRQLLERSSAERLWTLLDKSVIRSHR